MSGFSIHFEYPWLLLLLIPAAVLTVLPYLLLSKRFRRTRNRIISMVLHGIIMVLAILVLSGMTFNYKIENDKNEIIILADVSYTQELSADRRDLFIERVVEESGFDGFKVGIVTFGFDQCYAVPMTTDTKSIMNKYYSAAAPDTTATDIAAALTYASTLFQYPETAKIVLISDGKQTDENAISVARSIAASGIKIDTLNLTDELDSDGLRVTGITFPNYHIGLNEDCPIQVELTSFVSGREVNLKVYDNGELSDTQVVSLIGGSQSISINKTFSERGVHEIMVTADLISSNDSEADADGLTENNLFRSFFDVEVFSKVLILEQESGQSEQFSTILTESPIEYETEIVNLNEQPDKVPKTVNDLRKYDQVVLNNIANSDLPQGLDQCLFEYVYNYGGGLFTTGGSDSNGDAHSYNRLDLKNTIYQQMLPVEAIKYTPPIGVEILVDVSGSMSGSKLDAAKEGATQCLDVLSDRDYVGLISLSTVFGVILEPTRRTQEAQIKEAIWGLQIEGSTNFSNAIQRAGDALKNLKQVDKRHIIIISDGEPTENDSAYLPVAEKLRKEEGITISIVLISDSSSKKMETLAAVGGGNLYIPKNLNEIGLLMQDDLTADEIRESSDEEFHPVITDPLSNVASGLVHEDFVDEDEEQLEDSTLWKLQTTLGGFYGVRARASAETLMTGKYDVPIFSRWKFGKGMVGSFMCDVYGRWSSDFLSDANGKQFLINVVGSLMPTESIRATDIILNLREENYINQLGISTTLNDGERIEGTIYSMDDGSTEEISLNAYSDTDPDVYVTNCLTAENSFSRCNFVIRRGGLYRIEIRKCDSAGNVLSTAEVYKAFSYSAEYTTWEDTQNTTGDNAFIMASVATRGGGSVLDEDNPWSVFEDFETEIKRTYDPRFVFIIIAIVLFLLDIAVRKFKFKWLHEIIRDYKKNKAGQE